MTDIAERFARDTVHHAMTVLHDDGLYRHLRFATPDSGIGWFELITWPGSLSIRGDLDHAIVFSRSKDMFTFFRGKTINPEYWAEKTADYGRSLQEYSTDIFRQHVTAELQDFADENPAMAKIAMDEILAAIDAGEADFEDHARELLRPREAKGAFSDTWEWDLTDWSWSYLWACHAIVWGIDKYDAAKAANLQQALGLPTEDTVSEPVTR